MSGKSLASASPISINDTDFWTKLQGASAKKGVGLFKHLLLGDGPLYIINMNDSIKMMPFVRTAEELFEVTAKRESAGNHFKVVINGPTYGLTSAGKMDAVWGSDPVPASETLQQGKIVYNKTVIGGSKSNMYYIANYVKGSPPYKFGQGSAPENADAALGNMGPLIVSKLPFGKVNKYKPPQPKAVRVGQPKPEYRKSLVQRSNARFASMAASGDSVGKIAIGYRKDKGQLLVLVQPNGTRGVSISGLKGIALHLGLDSAVYLDGSDSVMLMMDNSILISQGSNKNETNITGIGFVY